MSAIPPLGGGGMDFDPKRRHPYQPEKKDGSEKPADAEKAEQLSAEEIEKIRIELRKRIKSEGRGERLDEIV